MSDGRTCPNCGAALPADAPAGQCPSCLFQIGLALADGALSAAQSSPATHGSSTLKPQPPATLRYFGDYELLEEIAHGGMGVVYKARQVTLNRTVAVKMIRAGVLASEADIHRFRTEAEAAGSLRHPHIMAIHEVGEHEGQHYFSMDYIEGQSLAELVREHPWSAERSAVCVKTIAEAIHYAHQHGILHRDLKPSNVIVDVFGAPHITDFGLAKRIGEESNLTLSGAVVGTPSYMAPEQTLGKQGDVGVAGDVYSMGAILYELLTGRPPFRGETTLDTLKLVRETDPVSPRLLNPKVPRDLETICLKCLEKEPKRRYGSAQEIADDLNRHLRQEPILARPATAFEHASKWVRRKPATAALSAVSSLTLLALMGVLAVDQLRRREHALRYQTQEALKKAEQAQKAEAVARDQEAEQRKRAEEALKNLRAVQYDRNIVLAERELSASNAGGADQILDECPSEFRNWEWHYLKQRCHAELRTFNGHIGSIVAVTFSREGASLISLSKDGALMNSDMAAGIRTSSAHPWTNGINRAALSANNSWLFVAGLNDRFDHVWDLGSSKEVLTVASTFSTFAADSVAISPNGELIAVATENDQTVRVWNLMTSELVRRLKGHYGCVNGLTFSPDGNRLTWGTGKIREYGTNRKEIGDQPGLIWLADTVGVSEPISLGTAETPVLATALSRDGRWLAAGRGDNSIALWDLNRSAMTNGSAPATILRLHTGPVLCLAFSESSSLLASGGADKMIVVWDMQSGGARESYFGHSAAVRALTFQSGGNLLASGSDDTSVKLWNLTSMRRLSIKGKSAGLAFSPDAKMLTSGSSIWSTENGKLLVSTGPVRRGRPAFSPDGKYFANGTNIFDTRTGGRVMSLETGRRYYPTFPYGVSFSPDGKAIAFGMGGGGDGNRPARIQFCDVFTGREMRTFTGHTQTVWDVAFSPDGRYLACASGHHYQGSGEARLWDVSTGETIQVLATDRCLYSISFSGDGKRFAASGGAYSGRSLKRGDIKVWDSASGQEVFSALDLPSCICSVALSPDGKRLVAAVGPFGELGPFDVKLWNVDTGREMLVLGRHESKVYGVAFSPDGKHIASGGEDGIIKIWSIE